MNLERFWSGIAAAAVLGVALQASAQLQEPQPVLMEALPLLKVLRVGETPWGRDDYFKLLWKHDAEGKFIGVDCEGSSGAIWAASQKSDEAASMTRLNAFGKVLGGFAVGGRIKGFSILEEGKKGPTFIAKNEFQILRFDSSGKAVELSEACRGATDFAVVPKEQGGPLIAVATRGRAGLMAFSKNGKLAWEILDIPGVDRVRLEFAGSRPVLAAVGGLGNISLVGIQGQVLERIDGDGNMDRVLFDRDKEGQWMYGLDSSAGSWREILTVRHSKPGLQPGARSWDVSAIRNLGPITVTAYALGRFDAGARRLVIGTDNGWVMLLDRSGATITASRFRGKIVSLTARDLDKDKTDELLVGVEGYSGNLFVYSR